MNCNEVSSVRNVKLCVTPPSGPLHLKIKRRNKMNKGDELDRISELPEHIIHHIQSFLGTKDAARTCILSKSWKSVCSSYPIINFKYSLFVKQLLLNQEKNEDEPLQIDEIREKFMDFVDCGLFKLLVHHHDNTRVRMLTLNLKVAPELSMDKYLGRLDHWLELLNQAQHVVIDELCLDLVVHTENNRRYPESYKLCYYDFPCALFAKKGLQIASISGCRLNSHKSLAGICSSSSSSSLKQLYLSKSFLDDEDVLVNLIASCPWIEVLEFEHCTFRGFDDDLALKLSNFPKLRKISFIDNIGPDTAIEIEATHIESFKCHSFSKRVVCKFLNPGGCRNIRELSLSYCSVYNMQYLFENLATTFPLLEEANISCAPKDSNAFQIQSVIAAPHNRLRSFTLSTSSLMEEIKLHCPNLRKFCFAGGQVGSKKLSLNCPSLIDFKYICESMPITPPDFHVNPSLCDQNDYAVSIWPKDDDEIDTSWFVELRRFINHLGINTIAVQLRFSSYMASFNLEELEDAIQVSQEYISCTLHVRILHDNMEGQAALVDGLLWSIHPTTLIVGRIESCYDFLKHLCDKLCRSKYGDRSNSCENCEEICNKHWWHQIKDFQVESNSEVEDIKDPFAYIQQLFLRLYRMGTICDSLTLTFRIRWL